MDRSGAKRTTTAVRAPAAHLPALAAKAERHHKATSRGLVYALDRALRCGDCLIEAKGLVKHGEWLPWLKANTTISARQAQKYMQLAENRAQVEAGKYELGAHLPINDAVALLAKPSEPESEPEPEDEPDEDDPEWYSILDAPLGAKVGRGRKTKAEAEKDAEEWRGRIAGLERKPRGDVCVVTADKLEAMVMCRHASDYGSRGCSNRERGEGRIFSRGLPHGGRGMPQPIRTGRRTGPDLGRLKEIAKRK